MTKGKCSKGSLYEKFDYSRRKNGEPYAHIYIYRRFNWVTTIKVNLNCFYEESPQIGFNTDIWTQPNPVKWLEARGSIT